MKPRTPIAVVSMAALFPGAPDLDTFWKNLCSGVSAARQVNGGRWGVEPRFVYQSSPAPDKTYSKRCCLVDGFRFDPSGFPLPESLLQALDPMHQMVLHVGRQAYSGCRTGHIDPRRIDVVLAAIALPTDGSSRITRNILGKQVEDAVSGRTSGSPEPIRLDRASALAGRVVGFPATLLAASLGLKGDAFTLDAACASSLYAVKLACDALADGKADAVIAGGVSRPDCLYTQVGFSQLRALSPSGQCAPFDADADGLVVGEGVGLLVFKRLVDAEADGDAILGVVRGIGLSNDLRGNLLAPAREGQLRAMRSAYREAGWDPMDVDLIECHGAGTPVGDTEELHSLTALWREAGGDRRAGCVIGSVKSHIGHLLTAAGAAGLIKTLLAVQHTTLPPTLHFRRPPSGSPLKASPFRVLIQPEPWNRRSEDVPRRAAVSAFGFGGINAHLLLEEHLPAEPSDSDVLPVFAVGGGRSAAADSPEAIAIVGMGVSAAGLENLSAFQDAVFQGKSQLKPPGAQRLRKAAAFLPDGLSLSELPGGFLEELRVGVGEFRIPPSEIPDLLLQQLLMLRAAAEAFADAGIGREDDKPALGAVIGIDFDFEATDFHLRWRMPECVSRWRERPDADSGGEWLQAVQDTCSPPLTATRTLGALGSVVASRVAREFHLGGPSFVVSADAVSGLKALEIAVRWLRQSEIDSALVGAVDMAGDLRRLCLTAALSPLSRSGAVRAFDGNADGTLPGEGAAALVLKRASDAAAQGDRIYAVIRGTGASGSGEVAPDRPAAEPYVRSLRAALREAHIPPGLVSYAETHGSGVPSIDGMEAKALAEVFSEDGAPPEAAIALGAVAPVVGQAGACAGLLSLAKASLCLYQQMLPPLPYACRPSDPARLSARFHLPKDPQF
ncbi:MAG: polyketide synthase, partial [Desulfobacteraceae bacterium]|nr:polyketide synthase [Desulfobacteraceae bacterium]